MKPLSVLFLFSTGFVGEGVVKELGGRIMMITCYRMPTGTSDLLDCRINKHNQ